MGGDKAVVLKRLVACRLGIGAGEGNIANLQQLRGGKEGHMRRVMKKRVADASLVDDHRPQPGLLCLNGAGQPGGPGAHHQQINNLILYSSYRGIAHGSRIFQQRGGAEIFAVPGN